MVYNIFIIPAEEIFNYFLILPGIHQIQEAIDKVSALKVELQSKTLIFK